jgi:hypothetical protein
MVDSKILFVTDSVDELDLTHGSLKFEMGSVRIFSKSHGNEASVTG